MTPSSWVGSRRRGARVNEVWNARAPAHRRGPQSGGLAGLRVHLASGLCAPLTDRPRCRHGRCDSRMSCAAGPRSGWRTLLKRGERVAREENRTKSELLRQALRSYVGTRDVRWTAMRDRVVALMDKVQHRTRGG